MRALVVVVAALAFPALASAEPLHGGSWDEIGVLRTRIDLAGGNTVVGEALRFAPRVPVSRDLYIGAELDTGSLSGRVPSPATYRSTGGEMLPTAAVTGKFGAVRAVIGTRLRFGIVSAAGELAVGVHAADLRDAYGTQIDAVRSDSTLVEGRVRVDLWVTPRLSVGAIAGAGLDDSNDATAGIMLGYHFASYDGMH